MALAFAGLGLAAALIGAAPALASAASCESPTISHGVATVTCPYRGELQTFTVPAGVNALQLRVEGAQGGYSFAAEEAGGEGGSDSGTLAVDPGEALTILVGGAGGDEEEAGSGGGAGGFGGGGAGGNGAEGVFGAPGGGGGSFVFRASSLVIAAGGGGGTGVAYFTPGGGGGGLVGGSGDGNGAGGGSQSSGGSGNTSFGEGATSGGGPAAWVSGAPVPGSGGHGANGPSETPGGGGGGGGYYGGGGGGGRGGGGGGSGYLAAELTDTSSSDGGRSGNGQVVISWSLPKPVVTISSPANGSTFYEGEVVATSFSCSEGESGGERSGSPIESCLDSNGSTSPGRLETSTPGKRTYTVTATSTDGASATAAIEYTVVQPTLTVTRAGTGSGTVTSAPSGIECGPKASECSDTVKAGTRLTLTAKASTGARFVGWSGAGCSGTATCSVTLARSQTVTAEFVGTLIEVLAAGAPVQAGTVGLYAEDLTLADAGSQARCGQTGESRLKANKRSVVAIALDKLAGSQCEDGRLISGSPGTAHVHAGGELLESASWKVELPDGCTYALSRLTSSLSFPATIDDTGLAGTAKLASAKHGVKCSTTAQAGATLTIAANEGRSVPRYVLDLV